MFKTILYIYNMLIQHKSQDKFTLSVHHHASEAEISSYF